MAVKQFKLPDLGEGLTEGDILKWLVSVGDVIDVNDAIAEVETVKAAVELPSPFAGRVTGLHAAEGETVPVGTPIISIEVDGEPPLDDAPQAPPTAFEDLVPDVSAASDEKQMTLVGYGPRDEGGGRRRRRRSSGDLARAAVTAAGANTAMNLPPASTPHPAPDLDVTETRLAATAAPTGAVAAVAAPSGRPLAKPPVRKLAKTLGVDLTAVRPTGSGGVITRDDVQAAVNGHGATTASPVAHAARETRIPIKGVRKHTAAAMVASAFTAPHVTEFVTVDVTATMELRDRVAARRDFRELKVSPLLFVAKAVLIAVGHTPELNSSWDESAGEIVQKNYVNLGIAAATTRGLIVPNIKDSQAMSLRGLAEAMAELTDVARSGRTAPEAMSGGTFTITNVGVFGVDTGTPILNPGESGILAFGAIRRMPWVVGTGADEHIEPRWVTQLAVSFDHRVVDGEQGSRFLAEVAGILHDPGLALL